MNHGTTTAYAMGCRCDDCSEAKREYQRNYRKKNRERLKSYNSKWRKDNQDWIADWRTRNEEAIREHSRRYYESHKDESYKRRRRRIAALHNAEGDFSRGEFNELKQMFGNRCVRCGIHESSCGALHADHIVPISRDGVNTIDNIQPLCPRCNLRKGNRDCTNYILQP